MSSIVSHSSFTNSAPLGKSQYKYSKLNDDVESASGAYADFNETVKPGGRNFVNNTLEQQQLLMRSQDDNMQRVHESVHVLKNISTQIGSELDEQAVMLDDISRNMDRTESKLDNVMKKIAKITHMSNDRRQWYAILALLGILLVVIILFVVL